MKPWRKTRALLVTVFGAVLYSSGGIPPQQQAFESGEHVLWTDPGDPSVFDFRYGIGGRERQPQPPFRFVSEDMSGTTPKVNVKDAGGTRWNVKFGEESKPSTFCTRLLWACGYFVQTEYFLETGHIEGASGLKRAGNYIARDGSFIDARFQLRSDAPRYLSGIGWAWRKNPFEGSPELQGLKILLMLVSNWDAKDARDQVTGTGGKLQTDSNLAIFADDRTGVRRYLYVDDDWGGAMGKWGNAFTRSKWDCRGFAEQTPEFVKVAETGELKWGFDGKHRGDLTRDIRGSDVKWLLSYLGKITDAQIRIGLAASGATPAEVECFSENLSDRIRQLKLATGEF